MNDVLQELGDTTGVKMATEYGPPMRAGEQPRPLRRRRSLAKPSSSLATVPLPAAPPQDTSVVSIAPYCSSLSKCRLIWQVAVGSARRAWSWLETQHARQLKSKRLTLCETVSLGEKRFLAIVQVDGQHFLVGGAPSSVSMLAKLEAPARFATVLQRRRKNGGTNA